MSDSNGRDIAWRRLRYRLARQGMLELDAWLARLPSPETMGDDELRALEDLLALEPPELQAMMLGERPLPRALARWLDPR